MAVACGSLRASLGAGSTPGPEHRQKTSACHTGSAGYRHMLGGLYMHAGCCNLHCAWAPKADIANFQVHADAFTQGRPPVARLPLQQLRLRARDSEAMLHAREQDCIRGSDRVTESLLRLWSLYAPCFQLHSLLFSDFWVALVFEGLRLIACGHPGKQLCCWTRNL